MNLLETSFRSLWKICCVSIRIGVKQKFRRHTYFHDAVRIFSHLPTVSLEYKMNTCATYDNAQFFPDDRDFFGKFMFNCGMHEYNENLPLESEKFLSILITITTCNFDKISEIFFLNNC